MSDEIDDKAVVFEKPNERLIHVHRVNLVENVRGEWTRPTLLIAAEGQTPVFCHQIAIGDAGHLVERPPGVHIAVSPQTKLVAYDADGNEIALPDWAQPQPKE